MDNKTTELAAQGRDSKTTTEGLISNEKLIAIFRHIEDETRLLKTFEIFLEVGIRVAEITLNTVGGLDLLSRVVRKFGDRMVLGAGTVMTPQEVRAAAEVGARFIVSPNLNPEVVLACKELGLVSIPGAFSPTEIYQAHTLGADFIKVFPAGTLGPNYFRELKGPMGHLRLVATGGVTVDNAPAFLRAGARAIGVGSALVDRGLVEGEDWERLGALARAYRETVAEVK